MSRKSVTIKCNHYWVTRVLPNSHHCSIFPDVKGSKYILFIRVVITDSLQQEDVEDNVGILLNIERNGAFLFGELLTVLVSAVQID